MGAPLDMVRSLLDEHISVKLIGSREVSGTLHAFDEHCNLVLGDVEETIYALDESNNVTSKTARSEMLFVRGDTVILIRP